MRLRRESGDFQLTFDLFTDQANPEKTKHIRKNLSGEDLIGLCITIIAPDDEDGKKMVARGVVVAVEGPHYTLDDHDNMLEYYNLMVGNKAFLEYHPKTGEIILMN